jgi:peptidyl-prolyl cis-trans isomerase A (cyclophilin A)
MISKRRLLALVAALAAWPALARAANPRVQLATPEGPITLELYADKAPVTAANFLKYVDRKLYDGASFYRASRPPGATSADYGLIQGGLQNDPKKVLPPIAHESTLKTGLAHTDGTISMGRHAPGTAQADWFICVGDQAYLAAPVDPNRGEGSMKGEMLLKPVRITSARRVP